MVVEREDNRMTEKFGEDTVRVKVDWGLAKPGRTERLEFKVKRTRRSVNLQDAVCYLLNLLYLGYRPPVDKGIIYVDQPVPWKRLKNGKYAESKEEFEKLKEKAKEGRSDSRFHEKIRRQEKLD